MLDDPPQPPTVFGWLTTRRSCACSWVRRVRPARYERASSSPCGTTKSCTMRAEKARSRC
eukprot:360460-Chlamydomonas_euryale.AAC.2